MVLQIVVVIQVVIQIVIVIVLVIVVRMLVVILKLMNKNGGVALLEIKIMESLEVTRLRGLCLTISTLTMSIHT